MNRLRTRQELAKKRDGHLVHGGGVVNHRIVLKRNPEGEPKPSDFEVVRREVPLLRTKWLTLVLDVHDTRKDAVKSFT